MNKKPKDYFEEKEEVTEDVFITETSQIQRHSTPGPTATRSINKAKKRGDDDTFLSASDLPNLDVVEQEKEKQIVVSLKKAPKDNTAIDGRINIISQIDGPREVLCCKYNEEFDYLAAGCSDGIIRVFQSFTGEPIFTLTDMDVKDNRAPVTCIQHRPVSKIYPITNCFTGTYANGCVKCWSYHFNQCLYTIKEKRQTFGITYHPRFPKFVTYGDDLKVYFYDEESKTQERVLIASEEAEKHDGPMSRVFAACFHPRNNYELITGGWDDVIQFWDLRQPYAVRHLSGVHVCGEGLDINAKGTEVLTCGFQTTDNLQLWDYGSGKRICCLEPDIFNSKLYCGRYVTKDFIVTGGTDPNMFRVVDLQTTATAASINFLPGAVYSLDIGQSKKKEKEKEKDTVRMKSDTSLLPRIAFVSTKKLYQVDFY